MNERNSEYGVITCHDEWNTLELKWLPTTKDATEAQTRDTMVIMKVASTWLTLVTGGGPTDDKPGVSLGAPAQPGFTSGFLNVGVADIARVYDEWSAKGAEFLTEHKDHGPEIRAYLRDPGGHLIEVGQVTGLLD